MYLAEELFWWERGERMMRVADGGLDAAWDGASADCSTVSVGDQGADGVGCWIGVARGRDRLSAGR